MRRKPAHCSNAFSPIPFTFFSSAREVNLPFWSRHSTMFFASAGVSPETRSRSGAEAVFNSTPTPFTQLTTTSSSLAASRVWLTSCWYWPTPMDLGSILTSSASGSCSRRPMDIAPRTVRSRSGNSLRAISEAE